MPTGHSGYLPLGTETHFLGTKSVPHGLTGPSVALMMFAILGDQWTVRDCSFVMLTGNLISLAILLDARSNVAAAGMSDLLSKIMHDLNPDASSTNTNKEQNKVPKELPHRLLPQHKWLKDSKIYFPRLIKE